MKQQNQDVSTIPGKSGAALIAAEVAAGALAGAAMGILAGPPGAAAGAFIGGVAGGLAGIAVERGETEERAHDDQLDRDMGIIGGTIGEPSLRHPPPRNGLYHAAVLGVGGGDAENTDGPIQNVDAA